MLVLEFVLGTKFYWAPQRSPQSYSFLPRHPGDCWSVFSSEEESLLPGPAEILETQGKHRVTSYHIVAFFFFFKLRGAADKLAPSVGDVGWMQLSHSLSRASCSFPRHPPAFLPALP